MRYLRFSETSTPTAFKGICCRCLQGTPKTEAGRFFQLLAHNNLRHFPEENNCPVYSLNVEAGGMYTYHEGSTDHHWFPDAIVQYYSCEEQSLWILDYERTRSI
jgi:hypothetical protein